MPWTCTCLNKYKFLESSWKRKETNSTNHKHIWARLKIRHPGNMLERIVLKRKPKTHVSVLSHTGVFEGPTKTLQLIHSPKRCETSFRLGEMNIVLTWAVWLAAQTFMRCLFFHHNQGICLGGNHLEKTAYISKIREANHQETWPCNPLFHLLASFWSRVFF